nr:unnamed protein product [Digitaria exilis]
MAQTQQEIEHGLNEGENQVVSTLPIREGWWKPFVLFQGCWLTPQAAESVKVAQTQFQPRPDDIILATYPKCGTTWLKALAFTIELEVLPTPRILTTHLPIALQPSGISTLGCRVVYLCREPKVVLVSTWHYMNKVREDFHIDLDMTFEFFCEGFSIFGPIWEHCLGYWKQSMVEPDRILFLKYNDMMADLIKHVKMLAEFLQVPFSKEEESAGVVEEVVRLCSFKNLKSLPVNSSGVGDRIGDLPMQNSAFFRSAKVGDWRDHLTEEMAKKLDSIIVDKLKGSGLVL